MGQASSASEPLVLPTQKAMPAAQPVPERRQLPKRPFRHQAIEAISSQVPVPQFPVRPPVPLDCTPKLRHAEFR
jgi:hypothetical protein